MAERRMFTKKIIDSDSFLDMPLSTQSLYFHLAMRADDDGFLNNAKKIMRTVGAAPNDYDLLVAKRFIIQFEDGICVIKHWRMHNYIQKDRYKETQYKEEKAMLGIKKNMSYTLDHSKVVSSLDTPCIQNVSGLEAQVRLGKVRLGKDRKDNNIVVTEVPTTQHDKFPCNSFEMLCVETLIHSCLESFPNSRIPSSLAEKEKWAVEIERMKRLDKRKEEEIKQALQYAIEDPFWKSNIRSAKKFREKFEVLYVQSQKRRKITDSSFTDMLQNVGKKYQ